MTIHFATGNENKVNEVSKILGIPIEIARLELDEIQDVDIEKVARRKVEHAFEVLKKPVFVDDVGVYFSAWNGFPGTFAKFLQDAGGNEIILRMLSGEKDRKVMARCVIAFHDGEKVHTFIGEMNGVVIEKPKGITGWGYDPIIIPTGEIRTYAEMGEEEKNKISHRALALKHFKEFLNSKESSKKI